MSSVMKNVAIFVDFTNGKLTSKSVNLWNKVFDLKYDSIVFYTFSLCKEYFLPQDSDIDLVVIDSNSTITFADSHVVSSIVKDLQLRNISNGFAIKSPLTDILIPQIAFRLNANVKSQVIDFNRHNDDLSYSISVFNNKVISHYSTLDQSVFILVNNNLKGSTINNDQQFIAVSPTHLNSETAAYGVVNVHDTMNSSISLSDAEIVVGAGRGLKDPSNWPMVEELANLLYAATACSKPVSDLDWRPHHEHVGQTGVKISPKIYIACGISGAIQHLAGVNSSKTIVVINNDREAPFFSHADFGIVGDVFDVLPRLIKKLKS
jgi:electron transfer flavoprotein alpha subunit